MNLRPETARLGELSVTGSYRYFSDVRPDNVDKLRLNIDVSGNLDLSDCVLTLS
jgi:hypothetical protein